MLQLFVIADGVYRPYTDRILVQDRCNVISLDLFTHMKMSSRFDESLLRFAAYLS